MIKEKEQAVVLSQERLAEGIFSMWIQTQAAKRANPGQFMSVYTEDRSRLLPRPISICEIDKDRRALRMVYRVTGEHTGTKQFSRLQTGDKISVIGPLGNGFPLERGRGKRVFLIGGGIGVPPVLELAKQLQCENKQIVAGYRDGQLFLKEDLEKYGTVFVATEDGSAGTQGNVLTVMEQRQLEADVIMACGPMPMLRAVKRYAQEKKIPAYLSL